MTSRNRFAGIQTAKVRVPPKCEKKVYQNDQAAYITHALNKVASTIQKSQAFDLACTHLTPHPQFMDLASEITGVVNDNARCFTGTSTGRTRVDRLMQEIQRGANPELKFHCTPPTAAEGLWQLGQSLFPGLMNQAKTLTDYGAGTGMLSAGGLQVLGDQIESIVMVDSNPELLSIAAKSFKKHVSESCYITTIRANLDHGYGFNLKSDVVVSNPDFDPEHLMHTIAMMEVYSQDHAVKMAIIPSHLWCEVRDTLMLINDWMMEAFPNEFITDRTVFGFKVPLDTGRSWSTFPNALNVHFVIWGPQKDIKTGGFLPYEVAWPPNFGGQIFEDDDSQKVSSIGSFKVDEKLLEDTQRDEVSQEIADRNNQKRLKKNEKARERRRLKAQKKREDAESSDVLKPVIKLEVAKAPNLAPAQSATRKQRRQQEDDDAVVNAIASELLNDMLKPKRPELTHILQTRSIRFMSDYMMSHDIEEMERNPIFLEWRSEHMGRGREIADELNDSLPPEYSVHNPQSVSLSLIHSDQNFEPTENLNPHLQQIPIQNIQFQAQPSAFASDVSMHHESSEEDDEERKHSPDHNNDNMNYDEESSSDDDSKGVAIVDKYNRGESETEVDSEQIRDFPVSFDSFPTYEESQYDSYSRSAFRRFRFNGDESGSDEEEGGLNCIYEDNDEYNTSPVVFQPVQQSEESKELLLADRRKQEMIAELTNQISEVNMAMQDLQNRERQAMMEASDLRSRNVNINNQVQHLQNLLSQNQRTGQDQQLLISQLRNDQSNLQSQLAQNSSAFNESRQNSINELTISNVRLQESQQRITTLEFESNQLNQRLESQASQLQELNRNLTSQSRDLTQAVNQLQLSNQTNRELEDECRRLVQVVSQMETEKNIRQRKDDDDDATQSQLIQTLEERQEENSRLQSTIEAMNESQERLEQQLIAQAREGEQLKSDISLNQQLKDTEFRNLRLELETSFAGQFQVSQQDFNQQIRKLTQDLEAVRQFRSEDASQNQVSRQKLLNIIQSLEDNLIEQKAKLHVQEQINSKRQVQQNITEQDLQLAKVTNNNLYATIKEQEARLQCMDSKIKDLESEAQSLRKSESDSASTLSEVSAQVPQLQQVIEEQQIQLATNSLPPIKLLQKLNAQSLHPVIQSIMGTQERLIRGENLVDEDREWENDDAWNNLANQITKAYEEKNPIAEMVRYVSNFNGAICDYRILKAGNMDIKISNRFNDDSTNIFHQVIPQLQNVQQGVAFLDDLRQGQTKMRALKGYICFLAVQLPLIKSADHIVTVTRGQTRINLLSIAMNLKLHQEIIFTGFFSEVLEMIFDQSRIPHDLQNAKLGLFIWLLEYYINFRSRRKMGELDNESESCERRHDVKLYPENLRRLLRLAITTWENEFEAVFAIGLVAIAHLPQRLARAVLTTIHDIDYMMPLLRIPEFSAFLATTIRRPKRKKQVTYALTICCICAVLQKTLLTSFQTQHLGRILNIKDSIKGEVIDLLEQEMPALFFDACLNSCDYRDIRRPGYTNAIDPKAYSAKFEKVQMNNEETKNQNTERALVSKFNNSAPNQCQGYQPNQGRSSKDLCTTPQSEKGKASFNDLQFQVCAFEDEDTQIQEHSSVAGARSSDEIFSAFAKLHKGNVARDAQSASRF